MLYLFGLSVITSVVSEVAWWFKLSAVQNMTDHCVQYTLLRSIWINVFMFFLFYHFPQCAESCEKPDISGKPNVVYTSKTNSSYIELRCKDMTFTFYGRRTFRCRNGIWVPPGFKSVSCEPITCPEDSSNSLNHELPHKTGVTVGSKIMYRCKKGYELDGRGNGTCQRNRKWSIPRPKCIKVYCVKPVVGRYVEYAEGSERNDGLYKYKTALQFRCPNCLRFQGSATLICEQNKTWSGVIPTCEKILCPKLPVPYYAELPKYMNRCGEMVKITCKDKGILGKGKDTLLCQESGVWDGEHPDCYAPCKTIAINNGTLAIPLGTLVNHGDQPGGISCLDKYALSSARPPICQNGTWNGWPACLKVDVSTRGSQLFTNQPGTSRSSKSVTMSVNVKTTKIIQLRTMLCNCSTGTSDKKNGDNNFTSATLMIKFSNFFLFIFVLEFLCTVY